MFFEGASIPSEGTNVGTQSHSKIFRNPLRCRNNWEYALKKKMRIHPTFIYNQNKYSILSYLNRPSIKIKVDL